MREILCRAKVKNSNDLVFGYYVKKNEIHYIYDIDICAFVKIDHNTLCQFTGLCDKNGTKIFDKDIIKSIDDDGICGVGNVIFLLGCWYVCGDIQNELYCINRIHDLKVIGNIHDNPELLRGGEKE